MFDLCCDGLVGLSVLLAGSTCVPPSLGQDGRDSRSALRPPQHPGHSRLTLARGYQHLSSSPRSMALFSRSLTAWSIIENKIPELRRANVRIDRQSKQLNWQRGVIPVSSLVRRAGNRVHSGLLGNKSPASDKFSSWECWLYKASARHITRTGASSLCLKHAPTPNSECQTLVCTVDWSIVN
jgi:hypothetical protein